MSPEIDPVVPGEFIFDTWGNPVARRTIQRYADQPNRDTLNPTPETGDLAFLIDTSEIQVFDGAAWIMGGGGIVTGNIVSDSNISGDAVTISGTFLHFLDASQGTIRQNVTNMMLLRDSVEVQFPVGTITLAGVIVRGSGAVFQVPAAWTNETGSGANLVVTGGSGTFARSTSARKYKENIVNADHLADLDVEPVTFTHKGDGKDFIGFIADDMPDERMIVRDDDGEVENYDLRAVVAILAAKVARLESGI